jgi:hypothetical protein
MADREAGTRAGTMEISHGHPLSPFDADARLHSYIRICRQRMIRESVIAGSMFLLRAAADDGPKSLFIES